MWRSEWRLLLVALVCGVGAFFLTNTDLGDTLRQSWASFAGLASSHSGLGGAIIAEAYPLRQLWLIPVAVLLYAAYRLYDVRYSVDNRAIEMRHGRLSWKRVITRIRFEDIRSIETKQTVVDQMLNIGSVAIGTAASAGTEVSLSGIANPRTVQQIIQREREEREQR